jgi:hypothetical protein
LTRNAFSSFLKRQEQSNTSEAVKSYRLEQYTADALVQFITDRNLEDEIDLVEGGHIAVFRTEEEERAARRDYEAARLAGVSTADLGIRWIENKELTEVSSWLHPILLQNEPERFYYYIEIWPQSRAELHGSVFRRTQSLAIQARYRALSRRPEIAKRCRRHSTYPHAGYFHLQDSYPGQGRKRPSYF